MDFTDDADWGDESPLTEEKPSEAHFTSLLNAPDYASFIKVTQTARARDYEKKVASILKAGAIGSIINDQMADGAAFLQHGPALATAAGSAADESPKLARVIDLMTAPDSPWLMLSVMTITLALQLIRNHEGEVRAAGMTAREARKARKRAKAEGLIPQRPAIEVRLPFGRKVSLRIPRPHFRLSLALRMRTMPPDELTHRVFSDEALIKALAKRGIHVGTVHE